MSRAPTTGHTRLDEQARRERLAQFHNQLSQQVLSLTSGTQWAAWLATAARFHHYSFGNTIAIWMQRPDASQVAGCRVWQSMDRQVRKGEQGIQILRPPHPPRRRPEPSRRRRPRRGATTRPGRARSKGQARGPQRRRCAWPTPTIWILDSLATPRCSPTKCQVRASSPDFAATLIGPPKSRRSARAAPAIQGRETTGMLTRDAQGRGRTGPRRPPRQGCSRSSWMARRTEVTSMTATMALPGV